MGWMRRLGIALWFYLAVILIVAAYSSAQSAGSLISRSPFLGGPRDWSNQHVIFTRNGSREDQKKLQDDPRFVRSKALHFIKEQGEQFGEMPTAAFDEDRNNSAWLENDLMGGEVAGDKQWLDPTKSLKHRPPPKNKHSRVDWSVSLGPNAGMAVGESPAIYTANYASPDCSNDFAVYTINATPSVGAQANLVGVNNLYSDGAGTGFCSGTNPSFLFAYAIGAGGSPLSPILSLDGTRVAWIENRTLTSSYLHVTIWAANDGTSAVSPIAPTSTFSNGVCATTGDSCDFALEYTASTYPGCSTAYIAANGHSDLYVDYTSGNAFISANNGLLYHIKNIFSTAANPSVDFCIPVNTGFESSPSSAMSGPVYDRLLNEVFITDSEKIYAYTVNASSFSLAASYTYGSSGSGYNYQTGPGPLLDVFNGFVYLPSTYDASGQTSVTQLPVNLASARVVNLGPKNTNATPILFYGAFDNNYYNNGPANAASTLYSCGTDSTTTTQQDLFTISFNASSGLMNTTPAMSYNANVNPGGTSGICSPITEFYDGTNDRIFVGMGQPSASTGSNVVTMWNVNSQITSASTTSTAQATNYPGGASGLSADNNANTTAQGENVYFSTEQVGPAPSAFGTGVVVSLSSYYNVAGIATEGTAPIDGGLGSTNYALDSNELGTSLTFQNISAPLGSANALDAVSNVTVSLPSGSYSQLYLLATTVFGPITSQSIVVTYSDTTTSTFTQSFSDWGAPKGYTGETSVVALANRITPTGTKQAGPWYVYGYTFNLTSGKTAVSVKLPANSDITILGIALGYGTSVGFNVTGIATDTTTFSCGGGLDGDGHSYSFNKLGSAVTWNGTTFALGTANVNDVWSQTTVNLPAGSYSTLEILGAAIFGPALAQTFTVTYTDSTTTTLTQNMSDWLYPQNYPRESIVVTMPYRDYCNGTDDNVATYLYGYTFGINPNKTVKTLTLPAARNPVVLGVALASNCGGQDYCAVKLTQNGLQ